MPEISAILLWVATIVLNTVGIRGGEGAKGHMKGRKRCDVTLTRKRNVAGKCRVHVWPWCFGAAVVAAVVLIC